VVCSKSLIHSPKVLLKFIETVVQICRLG